MRCTRLPKSCTMTNNCGTQARLYSKIPAVSTVKTFFLPSADGKPQFLMANWKIRKAGAPQAFVCWVSGCNRAQSLANFGLEDIIDGRSDVVLPVGVIYRHIVPNRRTPDYGLHVVVRVTIVRISSMRDTAAAATGKSAAVVVCNMCQPILDVARIQAKTVTKGGLNNDKTNRKGRLRWSVPRVWNSCALGDGRRSLLGGGSGQQAGGR